jgi:hypothetical protein
MAAGSLARSVLAAPGMRTKGFLIVFIVFLLGGARPVFADDGDGGDGGKGSDAADAEAADAAADGQAAAPPLACDGALCDTSNGAECAVRSTKLGKPRADYSSFIFFSSMLAIAGARRARRGAQRLVHEDCAR